MKKIAIYSPYLDTAGGGEKYMLTIAEVLSASMDVDVLLDKHLLKIGQAKILEDINKIHDLDLSKVRFKKAPLGPGESIFKRLLFLKNYDFVFYLTDGSIFYSTAKNNIIHFQVPFENSPANNSLWGKFKLSSWNKAIFNSKFTKEVVEKNWPIKGEIVYPPVKVDHIKPLEKKKIIISVGRFFSYLKPKKQDLMISAFKKLFDTEKISSDWNFHLAGGASLGDEDYLKELKELSKGYPIFIHPNISVDSLIKLYGESSIYWHATGYGETDPKKYEHFGITTVEAMAAGAVPVVIAKGGQLEIVDDGSSGYLFSTIEELIDITVNLIKNPKKLEDMSKKAIEESQKYSYDHFRTKIESMVN